MRIERPSAVRSNLPMAVLYLSATAWAVACEGTGGFGASTYTARDSAGIRISESTAPAWSDTDAWTIDPQPLLQIGAVDGEEPYLFTSIWTAVRHPDGRIAVVDSGTGEIRIFGVGGEHLSTMGGRGQGPGEFRSNPFLKWILPDTLVAWDGLSRRLTWFNSDGEVARDLSLVTMLMENPVQTTVGSPYAWQVSADVTLLALGSALEVDGEWRRSILRPTIVDPHTGTVTPLVRYRTEESISSSGTIVANSFTHFSTPTLRMEPLTVFVAEGARWELTGYGRDGSITEIVRASVPRLPVTRDMIEVQREALRNRAAEQQSSPAPSLAVFERFAVPDSLSAITLMMTDVTGNLWVSRNSPRQSQSAPWVYDVIDRDGRWLGAVTRPEGLITVFEMGDDYLLGHWRDALSVSYVRVHRIIKP